MKIRKARRSTESKGETSAEYTLVDVQPLKPKPRVKPVKPYFVSSVSGSICLNYKSIMQNLHEFKIIRNIKEISN